MHDICRNCGSKKVIPDLPVIVGVFTTGGEGVGTATVRIAGAPQAWLFKDVASGDLTVGVCGECGHAELWASNFRSLYQHYEKSRPT